MNYCGSNERIVIIKGDDTNFNGQTFLNFILNTTVLDLSTFKATFSLGGVTKEFNDISSGEIPINYTAEETESMPAGKQDGVLRLIDGSGRSTTIESLIPFDIQWLVHGDAIATKPSEITINVEQGGQTILDITVEAGVSVEVGETETLPAGSDAYVHNVGTMNHLILKFGVPQGEKGEDGAEGPEGPEGPAGKDGKDGTNGKDAKINGINTLTLTATNGVQLNQSGDTANIDGKPLQDGISDINSKIPSSASSSNKLADVDFVNSSINNMAAFYVTSDVAGDPFPTRASLVAGPWYFRGQLREPTQNDYALVTEDETHDDMTSRFMYDGTQWVWQYTLNNTQFTQAQIDAINSGITESLVNKIGQNESNITTLQNTKQDNINDLATIRSGAAAGATAVQPAAIANMATTNTAQDITAAKTFKTQQKLQYGGGDSCLIIGADVSNNTVTANTRKLGRVAFHTNESTTLNCAFVSTDTQDATSALVIKNCVEFGGRPADTTTTSPDVLNFTIAKVHNTTTLADKVIALSLTKDGGDFAVQPKYNGVNLQTESTIQALSATDSITLSDNTIYNGGEQTALTIALPATVDVSLLCEIDFTSGTTPATLAYSNTIKWTGDDVANNVFVPVASKRYTIICAYDGVNYRFTVKGVA